MACRRVSHRHALGGHDVPQEKIKIRWRRSLDLLPTFAAQADLLLVYDNSNEDSAEPPILIASGTGGQIAIHDDQTHPEVATALRKAQSGT